METPPYLRPAVQACSALSAVTGAFGMLASFLLLASECGVPGTGASTTYVTAGAAGFVAGAMLLGTGLLALALLVAAPRTSPATRAAPQPLALVV